MLKIKYSTFSLLFVTSMIIFISCKPNVNCNIKEISSKGNVATFKYDVLDNVSSIIVRGEKKSENQTYTFKRENGKITRIANGKDSLSYYIDSKQRIISYSFASIPDNVYESNLTYNPEGYLTKIEKQRFLAHGAKLFVTDVVQIQYGIDGNPNRITDTTVIAPELKENGEGGVTNYEISYYEAHEVEFLNKIIFTNLVDYLPGFIYIAYKGSAGILPNKLIRSIVQKTQDEASVRSFFTYKVDNKGNIIEMTIEKKDAVNRSNIETVRFSYQYTQ